MTRRRAENGHDNWGKHQKSTVRSTGKLCAEGPVCMGTKSCANCRLARGRISTERVSRSPRGASIAPPSTRACGSRSAACARRARAVQVLRWATRPKSPWWRGMSLEPRFYTSLGSGSARFRMAWKGFRAFKIDLRGPKRAAASPKCTRRTGSERQERTSHASKASASFHFFSPGSQFHVSYHWP